MGSKSIHIPNMSCGHCLMTIRNELLEIEGVKSVEGDISTKSISIQWNSPANWNKIILVLDEIGFSPEE